MSDQIRELIKRLKEQLGNHVIIDDDFYESEEVAEFDPNAMFQFFRGELDDEQSDQVFRLAEESKLFLDDLINVGEMLLADQSSPDNQQAETGSAGWMGLCALSEMEPSKRASVLAARPSFNFDLAPVAMLAADTGGMDENWDLSINAKVNVFEDGDNLTIKVTSEDTSLHGQLLGYCLSDEREDRLGFMLLRKGVLGDVSGAVKLKRSSLSGSQKLNVETVDFSDLSNADFGLLESAIRSNLNDQRTVDAWSEWIEAALQSDDGPGLRGKLVELKRLVGSQFAKGDNVLDRNTNELGVVLEDPMREAGEYWYKVRFGKRTVTLAEEDLDGLGDEEDSVQSLAAAGKWGDLDAVRCALAVERIRNTNRSTVYSFQSQRILFQPYQYKPLLKVLDSPDRRLLIADEVGLGKTIEAGLILTELNARSPLDSVMIVCPSRLREKWKNELNGKFDQDFTIYDRRSFEEAARLFVEKPGRTQIRGIMSMQAMRYQDVRDVLTGELGTLDLVIFDEAHHARNSTTSTHGLLQDLCEVSSAVLLLTATPVQLDNSNLFNLLNALRPTEFRDLWAFERSLERHADLHIASGLARTQDPASLNRIREILDRTLIKGRLAETVDPLARQLTEELTNDPPRERSEWIQVERRIKDLHPLGTILTRTKKRDVLANAPDRRPATYRCSWTTEEDEAYQRLVEGSGSFGWPSSSLSFGQVQRARQAASCLPAAYEHQQIGSTDDDATELTDILPSEMDYVSRNGNGAALPASWDGPDSKYAKFYDEILTTIWDQDPEAKILVFAFFKGTVRYLERRLSEAGVNVLRIDGDVPSDPRQPDKDERGKIIRKFKEDTDVRVLVSSEVGSEGLDFQFCHHLVNYDLPWNPMVVEQRIGRIDRFGQKHDKVFIHNLVVEGTVEDRILQRLYERIGIFKRSIGALEAILGETIQTLQRDYLKAELSPEEAERRCEQAANAIEQRQQQLDELEKSASQLFGHEEYVKEELNRVRNLGQFVSESSLLAILKTYFRSKHPGVRIKSEGNSVFAIKPTDELRLDIRSAARKHGATWHDRSRDGILRFTMSGEAAFEDAWLELVNSVHPMVRAAVDGLADQMSLPNARLGASITPLSGGDANLIEAGNYFVTLVPVQIRGVRTRRLIETIAINADTGETLDAESAQRLIYLATENGEDWSKTDPPSLGELTYQRMERELLRRITELRADEKKENEALYVRRKNALLTEHEHELFIKQKRLDTSRRNNKEKAVKLFQAQIEKARARHFDELAQLEGQQRSSVSPGEPVAVCVISVRHENKVGGTQ